MEMVHCNVCLEFYDENSPQRFFVTGCKHTFCRQCAKNVKRNGKCEICKVPGRIMEINDQLPPEFRHLFVDPAKLYERQEREMAAIIKFQDTQRGVLAKHMASQMQEAARLTEQAKLEKELLVKAEKELKARKATYRQNRRRY